MLKLGGEEAGFTVYSGMLSLGACLGYLLTALDWTSIGLTTSLGLSAGRLPHCSKKRSPPLLCIKRKASWDYFTWVCQKNDSKIFRKTYCMVK
jgi:hypothetical protein